MTTLALIFNVIFILLYIHAAWTRRRAITILKTYVQLADRFEMAAKEYRQRAYEWKQIAEQNRAATKGPTIPPFPNPGAKFIH